MAWGMAGGWLGDGWGGGWGEAIIGLRLRLKVLRCLQLQSAPQVVCCFDSAAKGIKKQPQNRKMKRKIKMETLTSSL